MISIEIFIFFSLIFNVYTIIYPCQYLHANEDILECNRCQCTTYSTIQLCSLTLGYSCEINLDKLRMKLNEIDYWNEFIYNTQIEYHHFHSNLFLNEYFCHMKNVTQITFYNTILNQTSTCLSRQLSIRFIQSYLGYSILSAEKFVFYNTTFNVNSWNFNLTKILLIHSCQFLLKPFKISSLPLLTHLTIIQTDDYHLFGRFSHLLYLNLQSNQLTDQKLNHLLSQVILPDLTTLILSNNSLTTISNKIPSTVRYLDLSKNHIKYLDYYSFKLLYSLNLLNLSYNSPLEIQSDTFTRIPYLEILDLTSIFPTLAFDDLFLPLQKLRYLNLSKNNLDILPQFPILYQIYYEHQLPILYIDLSYNLFEEFYWEINSTQDKYILSFNIQHNYLKTLKLQSNYTKRRGPFIEIDIQYNPLQCDCYLYEIVNQQISSIEYSLSFTRYHRQYKQFILNHFQILYLSNLTCLNIFNQQQYLFELNSSNSFCTYQNLSCPFKCSCQYSSDLTIHLVNCSYQQLKSIPLNIPNTTTHLYLQYNQIDDIPMNIFSNLIYLKELYLDHNIWIPIFIDHIKEFQWNKHLFHLTYANGLLCNRSFNINRPLMIEDCCFNSTNESCQIKSINTSTIISMNNKIKLKTNLYDLIDKKTILFLILIIILLLCIIILIIYIYHKKQFLISNNSITKTSIPFNDYSFTDDDYASIPLTISQLDLSIPVLHISSKAPPLPPPRPISHTSTTSTSITIHSNISRLKYDVLVIYSIDNCEYVHQSISQSLENIYGQRFSFYYIHRHRILTDIQLLIEHSSIIIFILRKPYNSLQSYRKICSNKKCFIILINPTHIISLKLREKLARLYQTSNIYEWNTNPNALIHEQLELFLEQNSHH